MKRKKAALGVDFGTTSISAALLDIQEGAVLKTVSEKAGAYIPGKNPLYREQDQKKVRDALYRAVSSCVDPYEAGVVSVGITGQMHGIVGLDEDGVAVTDLVTWQDRRGHERGPDGRTLLEEIAGRAGAFAGSHAVSTGYGVVTLFDWTVRKKRGDIRKVCTIPDFFSMVLTGCKAPLTDPTMADSIGAYDLLTGAWDDGYLTALGIDPGLFPDIVPSPTVLGRLEDGSIRPLLGGERPPVACCIGDNQASFIGGVRDHEDSLLVNIGTASQVSFCIEEIKEGRGLSVDGFDVVIRPFTAGKLLVSGNALSGGCSYERLAVFFKAVGETLFGVPCPPDLYERMSALVKGHYSAEGLDVRPFFSGMRSDPCLRGSIRGLSDDNFTPTNLVYGTMEGIAAVLKNMVEPSVLAQRSRLIGGGNALRKNETLRKIVGRVFGKDLVMPLHEEEAAAGAAIHGAIAAGAMKGYSEASRVIRYSQGS
jgi:sedoheptulokinase